MRDKYKILPIVIIISIFLLIVITAAFSYIAGFKKACELILEEDKKNRTQILFEIRW